MDRKSIIGLLLIGAILIGWMFLTKPSPEQLAKQKAQYQADSTAQYNSAEQAKKEVLLSTRRPIPTASGPSLAPVRGRRGRGRTKMPR